MLSKREVLKVQMELDFLKFRTETLPLKKLLQLINGKDSYIYIWMHMHVYEYLTIKHFFEVGLGATNLAARESSPVFSEASHRHKC